MSATDIPVEESELNGSEPAPAADDWLTDKQGRQYVRARGRRGIIYRSAGESLEEAFTRDALPRDKKPRKTRTPKKPPPPRQVDLKELELLLAETFKAPAMPCAAFGDQWAATHFTNAGPYLARNLVVAAEHNPWLRKKLEKAADGGDWAMRLMALVPLCGAVVMYTLPPLVYWFNVPFPEEAREMFGIPDRKDGSTPPAPPASSAPAPPAPA